MTEEEMNLPIEESHTSTTDISPVSDPIEKALAESKKKVKEERSIAIGVLLDKATAVLSDILDTTDDEHEPRRMRAAELTIGLYTANESSIRADKQLDIQAKRLQIEEKKVGVNTLLLQQNNIYSAQTPAPPKNLVQNVDGSVVDVDLLARKKAQQMLLDAQLAQAQQDLVSDASEIHDDSAEDPI